MWTQTAEVARPGVHMPPPPTHPRSQGPGHEATLLQCGLWGGAGEGLANCPRKLEIRFTFLAKTASPSAQLNHGQPTQKLSKLQTGLPPSSLPHSAIQTLTQAGGGGVSCPGPAPGELHPPALQACSHLPAPQVQKASATLLCLQLCPQRVPAQNISSPFLWLIHACHSGPSSPGPNPSQVPKDKCLPHVHFPIPRSSPLPHDLT